MEHVCSLWIMNLGAIMIVIIVRISCCEMWTLLLYTAMNVSVCPFAANNNKTSMFGSWLEYEK